MKEFLKVFIVMLAIGSIIIAPILTILSLNALFNLGIAITIWNYLAVLWLNLVSFGGIQMKLNQMKGK